MLTYYVLIRSKQEKKKKNYINITNNLSKDWKLYLYNFLTFFFLNKYFK